MPCSMQQSPYYQISLKLHLPRATLVRINTSLFPNILTIMAYSPTPSSIAAILPLVHFQEFQARKE
jgi:hypothetical protein